MNFLLELITKIEDSGGELTLLGDRVRVNYPRDLKEALAPLLESLRAQRAEVADFLRMRFTPPPIPPGDDSVADYAALATLLGQNLRALPEGRLGNVQKVATHLATVALNYMERLAELRGTGMFARTVQRAESLWWSRCPKGHFTDEYLWVHQCVGIVCPRCLGIYDPKECHLEPRAKPPEKDAGTYNGGTVHVRKEDETIDGDDGCRNMSGVSGSAMD